MWHNSTSFGVGILWIWFLLLLSSSPSPHLLYSEFSSSFDLLKPLFSCKDCWRHCVCIAVGFSPSRRQNTHTEVEEYDASRTVIACWIDARFSIAATSRHDSGDHSRLATFLPPWTDKMKRTASTLPRRSLLLGSPRTQGNDDSNLIIQMWPAAAGLKVGGEGGVSIVLHCDLRLTCTDSVGILS